MGGEPFASFAARQERQANRFPEFADFETLIKIDAAGRVRTSAGEAAMTAFTHGGSRTGVVRVSRTGEDDDDDEGGGFFGGIGDRLGDIGASIGRNIIAGGGETGEISGVSPDDLREESEGGLSSEDLRAAFAVGGAAQVAAIDSGRGALAGALSPEGGFSSIFTDPIATAQRTIQGAANPEDFRGTDIVGIRSLSDRNLVGSISARDLAGFGSEIALDPMDIIMGGGLLQIGGGAAFRLARKSPSLTRTAVRRGVHGGTSLWSTATGQSPSQIIRRMDPTIDIAEASARIRAGSLSDPNRARMLVRGKNAAAGGAPMRLEGYAGAETYENSVGLIGSTPNLRPYGESPVLGAVDSKTDLLVKSLDNEDDAITRGVKLNREYDSIEARGPRSSMKSGVRSALMKGGGQTPGQGIVHRSWNALLAEATLPGGLTKFGRVNAASVARKIPKFISQSWIAEGIAKSDVGTRLFASRQLLIHRGEELFGGMERVNVPLRESVTTAPSITRPITPVAAISKARGQTPPVTGQAREATRALAIEDAAAPGGQRIVAVPISEHPATGTLPDIFENPALYDLTPEQTAWLGEVRRRIEDSRRFVNTNYGTEISEYGPEPFITHIDKSENGLLIADDEIRAASLTATGNLNQKRTFATIAERMAVEAGFDPELNLRLILNAMDDAKGLAAGRATFAQGIGGTLVRNGKKGIVEGIEIGGETRYFTRAEANHINNIQKTSDFWLTKTADLWRQTVLAGDLSPLTGIQIPLGLLFSPKATVRQLVTSIKGDRAAFSNFTANALATDVANDFDSWIDFSTMMGRPIRASTPEEFRTGLLGQIRWKGKAVVNEANEGMFNVVLRMMKRQYVDDKAVMIDAGFPPETAAAAAIDTAMRTYPIISPRKLNQSQARSTLERALPTSVAFIRQPATMMNDFVRGSMKLVGGNPATLRSRARTANTNLTPQEQLAIRRGITMMTGVSAMAALSQAFAEREHGVEASFKAAVEGVFPFGRDGKANRNWWRLSVPSPAGDLQIPMGGPFRSLANAVLPDHEGRMFGRLLGTARSRIGPLPRIAIDLGANGDFLDRKIRDGSAGMQVLQSVAYAVEGSVPTVGQPGLANLFQRVDSTGEEVAVDSIGNFFGVNPLPPTARDDFRELFRTEFGADPNNLDHDQISGEILRADPEVRAAFEKIDDERRSDLDSRVGDGDRVASALALGYETRDRLEGAESAATTRGVLDLKNYRERRSAIMQQQRGKLDAYADVFEDFKQSGDKTTQLASLWYDLWGEATGADGLVDMDVFESLEAKLEREVGSAAFAEAMARLNIPDWRSNEAEKQLQAVRNALNKSTFFDIRDEAWSRLPQTNPELGQLTQTFPDFFKFRETWVDSRMREIMLDNRWENTPSRNAVSREMAVREFDNTGVSKMFTQTKNAIEREWIGMHLSDGLAEMALSFGYLSANKEELAAIANGTLMPSQFPGFKGFGGFKSGFSGFGSF